MNFGFPMISTNTALVLLSMAAAKSAGSPEATNLTPMPNFLNVTKVGLCEVWVWYGVIFQTLELIVGLQL